MTVVRYTVLMLPRGRRSWTRTFRWRWHARLDCWLTSCSVVPGRAVITARIER